MLSLNSLGSLLGEIRLRVECTSTRQIVNESLPYAD